MKSITFLLLLLSASVLSMHAQYPTTMPGIFAALPDSIFPLLTRNNRLDCIDFIQNDMPAKVKNKLDSWSELKVLTDDYMMIQISERSYAEMKLVDDSTLCLVRTYLGPAADSEVRLFTSGWAPLDNSLVQKPQVSSFIKEGMDTEVCGWLEALPLMKASLSPENNTLTWELQTTELTKEQKKAAEGYLQPVSLMLK